MKVYLAARYSRNPEMRQYRDELVAMGHTVTSQWINGKHEIPQSIGGDTPVDYGQRFALEDWQDVFAADVMIAYTEAAQPQGSRSRGGRHVELGLALAWGKDIIVVGPRENVFYYLPEVTVVSTWEQAKQFLRVNAEVVA